MDFESVTHAIEGLRTTLASRPKEERLSPEVEAALSQAVSEILERIELHRLTSTLSATVLQDLTAACAAAGAIAEVRIAQCPRGCNTGLYIDIDEKNKKLRLNCPRNGHGPWEIGDIR